jgi:hypothetical protein
MGDSKRGKLHADEIRNLVSLPDNMRVVKPRSIRQNSVKNYKGVDGDAVF